MMRLAALLTAPVAALVAAAPLQAAEWRVVSPESRIGFVATYEDTPFDARFRSFDADIRFQPGALDEAEFDVRIDVTSVDSDSPDRDEGMKSGQWLAAADHPGARFHAERFERISENRYKALGTLRLKGTTSALAVPFTWEQSGNEALLTARAEVRRGVFNIGSGEWAEDDTIGFTVTIEARLELVRR